MKVGIDLDGTAWKYPFLFTEIVKGLKSQGHTVGIVTAHRGLREADLNLWAKRGFPKPDFYISRDTYKGSHKTVKQLKLAMAKDLDYLIDDFDTDSIQIEAP